MKFELPAAIYSPELLESVIYEIGQYLEWYHQNRAKQAAGAALSTEEPTHSAETVLVIEAWLGGQKPTIKALEELIAHLKNLNLPTVHITLAALPNHAQRAQFVDWFRATAARPVLVTFVADRGLGGGVMVRTPNRIFDYTWRQRLIDGRAKLTEILSRA